MDTWMVVSVGGWWLGGYMDGCVCRCVLVGWMYAWICPKVDGGWVDVCMNVSVGRWWLGGLMDGCVGRYVVVGWIHGWMCR